MRKTKKLGCDGYRSFIGLFMFFLLVSIGFLSAFPIIGIAADPPDLMQSRQECLNVPNCVSVPMKASIMKGNKESVLLFICPANAPFLWNWDSDHSRDVSITLKEESPRHVMLHIIDNDTRDPSTFKIFLGCSAQDVSRRVVHFTQSASGKQVGRVTAAPVAAAKNLQSIDPPNPCTAQIQNCTVATTDTMALLPSETRVFDVYCPSQAPYYRAWTAGRSSDWIGNYNWDATMAGKYGHFTATNWDPGQTHGTRVSIACSTDPSPTGCYQVGTKEDGCTIIESELICPDEKCFSLWKLQCPDGRRWDCDTMWFVPCCRPPRGLPEK